MSEGHVYLCKWECKDEWYRVWVEKRPRLKAEGVSLGDASEELVDLICRATGDGEAVLEFERPPSNANSLVALSGNGCWYPAEGEWWGRADELYEGGICSTCCTGIGRRTAVPLRVGSVGNDDLLRSWFHFCDSLIASERFRRLLSPRERSALEWRPVEFRKKTRREYFEIIPKNLILEIADRKHDYHGWRCPACRRRALWVPGYHETYIATADLPDPKPKLLAVQSLFSVELVLPAARWKKLRGKPGTSGITTKEVVLIPSARVVRRPTLPLLTRKQIAPIRRQHKWQLKESLVDKPQIAYNMDGSVIEVRST